MSTSSSTSSQVLHIRCGVVTIAPVVINSNEIGVNPNETNPESFIICASKPALRYPLNAADDFYVSIRDRTFGDGLQSLSTATKFLKV